MRRPLVVLFAILATFPAVAQDVVVRILLEQVAGPVEIEMEEGHRGLVDGRELFDTPLGITWPVEARENRVLIDGTEVGAEFTLVPRSGEVAWDGSRYRGALRLAAQGNEVLVINVVGLEEYLRGVVPAEMMAVWPLEALKAQAVASRTYVLGSLDPGSRYDICATVECQAYSGMAAEHPRSDRAIAETEGLVLTFDGRLARTYYHSDSGGTLASSAEVWGMDLPYLAVRSDVSARTPHRSWSAVLDPARMEHVLSDLGYYVGTVSSLRIDSYSESGRALRAQIAGSAGRVELSGATLTRFLRELGLKSTRIRMVDALTARGDGWGHGVGMSQYGARALAESGLAFDRILAFYYPETRLEWLDERHYALAR